MGILELMQNIRDLNIYEIILFFILNYILDFEDPLIAIISKFSSITSWQIDEEKWKQGQILFSWAPKSPWMMTAAMMLKDTCSLEGKL